MAAIRRHPAVFGLCTGLLISILVAGWWIVSSPAPAAAAAAILLDEPTPLDPVVAAQIERLRRDAGLDDDALVCLNISLESLTTTLESVKAWHAQNTADVTTKQREIADCNARIRAFQAAINNGQDAATSLATAREELAGHLSEYESLLAAFRTATTSNLTEGQRGSLEQLRARGAIAMPYRALALNTQQDGALTTARIRYEQQRSVSHDAESQSAALTTFIDNRNDAIGSQNVQALSTLQSYWSDSAARVVAARNAVLPQPSE